MQLKREWLYHIRKTRRLTQQQIANRAYINRSYYSQIENGNREPSYQVAVNIAKVLDIDPAQFLKKLNSSSTIQSNQLFPTTGPILYLYNSIDRFKQNLFTFLLTGLRNNHVCYMIAPNQTLEQIHTSMDSQLFEYSRKHRLVFDDEYCHERLSLISKKQAKPLYIWYHIEQIGSETEFYKIKLTLELLHATRAVIVVSSDAATTTANLHIALLREFPHMMTDDELVDSPLYKHTRSFNIYPTLFIQDDTKA